MKRKVLIGLVPSLALALLAFGAPRWNQPNAPGELGRARVSIYRIAPGRQLDYLRWQAAQDEVAKAAGVAPPQVYAHVEGADWDYLVVFPVMSPEQERRVDEIARERGRKTGFKASLEFRQWLASHTDTVAAGPTTAAELVAAAER